MIRTIIFGGEGYPKSELKKLYDRYQHRMEFVNVYGPTEGTCICSSYSITEFDFEDTKGFPSLGSLNGNFEYLILDEADRPTSCGELCILGPNVALGYYNDPERSAKAFSRHYKHGFYGSPIYRTGDFVREHNGLLYFVGRRDNQIKHMGYRIELEEIEIALNNIDGISQAAVVYERVTEAFGKIVAHVACNKNYSQNTLRTELKEELPEYMIPNLILFQETLPRNQNGKIDKSRLRKTLVEPSETL